MLHLEDNVPYGFSMHFLYLSPCIRCGRLKGCYLNLFGFGSSIASSAQFLPQVAQEHQGLGIPLGSPWGRTGSDERLVMFDFDELDSTLPVAKAKAAEAAVDLVNPGGVVSPEEQRQQRPEASAPSPSVGPPSLESLLSDASDASDEDGGAAKTTASPHEAPRTAAVPTDLAPRDTPVSADTAPRHLQVSNLKGPRPPNGNRFHRLRVPVVPPVRGAMLPADEELFMWMAQKAYLGQDPISGLCT